MMRLIYSGLAVTAVAGMLAMTSCNSATTLEDITTVAELAVSTLATADPTLPGIQQASSYVDAVGNGINCAVLERESTDTAAVQDVKIAACFVNAVAPVLPSGTVSAVVNIIGQVATDVANYIASLSTTPDTAGLVKLDGGSLEKMGVKAQTFHQRLINHAK